MISIDRVFTVAYAARMSWRDFIAIYTPRVYLTAALPRSILQATFLALLGYYAGGVEGREFAFIGACAHIILLATVVRAPDVLIDERIMGTLYRLRLGNLPLGPVVAARWWIYICAGVLEAIVAIVAVGAVLGEFDLVPRLLASAGLFALLAATTSSVGLLIAAISLTHRVDVLLTNVAAYVMLVFCGVVAPIGVFGDVGESIVRLLPLTNGLLAIRASVAGESWLSHAAAEITVAGVWATVAFALLHVQQRRSRSRGTDELL